MADDETDWVNEQINTLRAGYLEMFGEVPPAVDGRFSLWEKFDRDGLLTLEHLRATAYHSEVFEPKITQLILFAVFLAGGDDVAWWHARAARQKGATWEELVNVLKMVAAAGASRRVNEGAAILLDLRGQEPEEE